MNVSYQGQVIKGILEPSAEAWKNLSGANIGEFNKLANSRLFNDVLRDADPKIFIDLMGSEKFTALKRCIEFRRLENKTFAIYGDGTFGKTLALLLTEAGATGTIYSSAKSSTAMRKALGILEPQGLDVQPYWVTSLDVFNQLINLGAPIRKDLVVYNYAEKPSDSFIKQLQLTPNSNYSVENSELAGCKQKLSFHGYIMSCSRMSAYYTDALKERGVKFIEREINEVTPMAGADMTFSALGHGRHNPSQNIDLPGNRGQIIVFEGPLVKKLIDQNPHLSNTGSYGVPLPTGSINFVVQHTDASHEQPYLLVGATKEKGCGNHFVREEDYKFLRNGIKSIWPELFNAMEEMETCEDPKELLEHSYACVRPGGGDTSFTVTRNNGCIDIYAAGGMGNSLAPGAALHAVALGLEGVLE